MMKSLNYIEHRLASAAAKRSSNGELERAVHRYPLECLTALEQCKQLLASHWKGLILVALYEHQEKWIQVRREWQVITYGKAKRDDRCRTDPVKSLSLLFPERWRLAQKLASEPPQYRRPLVVNRTGSRSCTAPLWSPGVLPLARGIRSQEELEAPAASSLV